VNEVPGEKIVTIEGRQWQEGRENYTMAASLSVCTADKILSWWWNKVGRGGKYLSAPGKAKKLIQVLVRKRQRKRPIWETGNRWEDNIKIVPRDSKCKIMEGYSGRILWIRYWTLADGDYKQKISTFLNSRFTFSQGGEKHDSCKRTFCGPPKRPLYARLAFLVFNVFRLKK
jgi:hypothetical protein